VFIVKTFKIMRVLVSIYRFSSGDLTQECDDGASDPGTSTGRTIPPPLQQQPLPGGPPNIPAPNPPGINEI
jgi:synapsin